MKIKLDENLPLRLVAVIKDFGHDVDTVVSEGYGGRSDDIVFSAAKQAKRMLITLDRGFADVRRYSPGTHSGIVIIRPPNQNPQEVVNCLKMFLNEYTLDELEHCIVIAQQGLVRIRWPSPQK